MTVTWVPKCDRKPKWARWAVLNNTSGKRIAYFQILDDAIDFVYYTNDDKQKGS